MLDKQLLLRPVQQEDCRLLWEWANDPVTRQNAFSSEPIPWADHVRWFESKLKSSTYVHYMALNEQGERVGQIRFDIDGHRATISVTIATSHRGCGYGSAIIKQGVLRFLEMQSLPCIEAYVKTDNLASVRAFERAGFQHQDKRSVQGFNCYYLTWPIG